MTKMPQKISKDFNFAKVGSEILPNSKMAQLFKQKLF